jgi:hypothetical protein
LRRHGCRFDFPVDRVALAPQHVGTSALQRPLAEFLLVLRAGLDEKSAAAMFQPADGLLAFGPGVADATGLLADGLAAGGVGFLPSGDLRELAELLDGIGRAKRRAGVGRKLYDPCRERVQFPLPAQQVFPMLLETALCVDDPLAALREPADLLGIEIFRQADHRKRLAPTSPGRFEFLLRLARAARGGFRFLPGRTAAGVQRRQLLQGGQLLFRGL